MTAIEIVSYIKFYLGLLLNAHMSTRIHISPEDTSELIRIREQIADMCDKYGLDRFEEA